MAINISALWPELLNVPNDNPLPVLPPFLAVRLRVYSPCGCEPQGGFHAEPREMPVTGTAFHGCLPAARSGTDTGLSRTSAESRNVSLPAAGEMAGHVPRFVDRELRAVLECGVLACGFLRRKCESCKEEKLVPYSCKGRACCPSCCGRRMADTAAHLVDHVFPRVPVRQWVLSLPFGLRYRLALRSFAALGRLRHFRWNRLLIPSRAPRLRRRSHPMRRGLVVQRYGGSSILMYTSTWPVSMGSMPRMWTAVRASIRCAAPPTRKFNKVTETLASRIAALVERRFGECLR